VLSPRSRSGSRCRAGRRPRPIRPRLRPRTHAPGLVAVQVQGDVVEAQVRDVVAGRPHEVGVQRHVEFFLTDLDACRGRRGRARGTARSPRSAGGARPSRRERRSSVTSSPVGMREERHAIEGLSATESPYSRAISDLLLGDVVFEQRRVGVQFLDGAGGRGGGPRRGRRRWCHRRPRRCPATRASSYMAPRRIDRQW